MKVTIRKRRIIQFSLVVLLVGVVAGRANADSMFPKHIELLSYSFGVSQTGITRISLTLAPSADPQLPGDPVSTRIQILDTKGDVIAQSGELRVLPGQTQYWDVARDLLPASREPGGRLQVRARMLVTTHSYDLNPESLMPTLEVFDSITGNTLYHNRGAWFLRNSNDPGQ